MHDHPLRLGEVADRRDVPRLLPSAPSATHIPNRSCSGGARMIPLRLKLRGFIGIRSGTGKDEIELDLKALTGDAALVALAGQNGAGKTTILDNLHPYRLLPSRASSYSPDAFSYYDHTFGDALKELTWEHDGATYQSSIVIKGSIKNKKQECYLFRVDGAAPEPLNDGKTATYDAAVEAIIGSPELFFTAAFACQGRRSLADYANADVKSLMSELLGLESIRKLGDQANEVAKGARTMLESIRGRLGRADQVQNDAGNAGDELAEVEHARDALLAKLNPAREAVTAANRVLAEAQSTHAQQAETQRRRDTLATQIGAVREREATAVHQIGQDVAVQRTGIQRTVDAARAEAQRLNTEISMTEGRIRTNEATVATRQKVDDAAARLDSIVPQLADAEAAVVEAEATVKAQAELEKELAKEAAALRELQSAGKALKTACDELHARSALIDEVPCKGTDLQGKCNLLAEARTAKESLPGKQNDLDLKRGQREELDG